MTTRIKTINELISEAVSNFKQVCDKEPTIYCCAPGRVNLIGGHTDYNEGFVLPMALPLVTVCAGAPLNPESKYCRIISSNIEKSKETIKLPIPENYFVSQDAVKGKKWSDYVVGTMLQFQVDQTIPPFALSIASSVPLGGGLSSSAALEVGVFTFLELLCGKPVSKSVEKAIACQNAEHLVGIPCGIMDQFISVMGKQGHMLLVDCKSREATQIPVLDPTVGVLITNSNIRHALGDGAYEDRKQKCEIAAQTMGKRSLRECNLSELNSFRDHMTNEMYERAFHVITEIERTKEAVEALKANDHDRFGKLITQSHISLRDNYQVSCKELDQIVSIANDMDGVFGSRLVGGGFGGCTVTWMKLDKTAEVIDAINKKYEGTATFYVVQASEGARLLSPST